MAVLRRAAVFLTVLAVLYILIASQHLAHLTTLEVTAARGRWHSTDGARAKPLAVVPSGRSPPSSGVAHVGPLRPGAPEEQACAELLGATSRIMFMVLGGRGYHHVRVRTILHSWARCVKHVLVFTDPSVNVSSYLSDRRFVYLAAGDAWRRRPYLPMTHSALAVSEGPISNRSSRRPAAASQPSPLRA